jgi:transposase
MVSLRSITKTKEKPMTIVSLDVHTDASQLVAMSEDGRILLEMKVATKAEELRRIVKGIAGYKQVVFEEGPMSGMIYDALVDVADEIISCDPAHNAMIARSEKKTDESDARWLAKLAMLNALNNVYIPPEPYRTLRSLLMHDYQMMKKITGTKNRIKAMCRRNGIPARGVSVYRSANRPNVLAQLPNPFLRWQMSSLYRVYDMLRTERVGVHRLMRRICREMPEVQYLTSIPGVGHLIARTLVGWIVHPDRFATRSKLNSYAGLGLGQGWTNWQPIGAARASKRGQRVLKRVLFIAANAAIKGDNALARRYRARIEVGWDSKKANRDIARKILHVSVGIIKHGVEYDDSLVKVHD